MSPCNTFLTSPSLLGVKLHTIPLKTNPYWRQGAKNCFSSTFQNILFAPQNHLATPWQHPGTTRDHLVTTWHHQIAWGTTWEPYEAIKLAKTAAIFQSETPKIQILVILSLKMAIVLASFAALYGLQVVPHAIWWCQVVNGESLVVPGCCQGGFLVVIRPKMNV